MFLTLTVISTVTMRRALGSLSNISSVFHYGKRLLRCPQRPNTIMPAPMAGSRDDNIKGRDYPLPKEEGDAAFLAYSNTSSCFSLRKQSLDTTAKGLLA